MGAAHDRGAALTTPGAAAKKRRLRREKGSPGRRRGGLRRYWPIIPAVLVVALIPLFVAEPVRVTSSSMSPTLHDGDQVLIEKIGSRAHHPHRRDVIAFHAPGTSGLLIKRVVAIAGDSVGIEDGVLVVNGRPMHEPFVDYNLMDATYFGPVRVPPNAVFTMGDNRSDSVDSRRFGPVHTMDIVGRVIWRFWPW